MIKKSRYLVAMNVVTFEKTDEAPGYGF
ncbi:hypothetical protein CBM2609_A20009 [Cupriavidus taiwanensis]|nr:hypothetical protein CBM2604_A20008 [Cupriavidus taiwanensis]SOZ26348.1 hypothetical protein CBM2609_A20009 [Cupriavidus taiwanensis]